MVDISTLYNGVRYSYGKLAKGLSPQLVMPPLRITFETTYRCNLSCSFCFQEIAREQSPEFRKNFELDGDEILRVVDDLPRYSLITFNGGEVFVRKDFPDILREVHKRGRRFNIVTNGTMLFDDKIRLLVDETKALSVGISIDGIGDTHDQIRQLPKAFERTVSNMRDLVAYRNERGRKFPVVDMKTVITGQNLSELEDIYDLGRDIGVDYLTFSCLRTSELLFALPCRASMDDGAYAELPPALDEDIDLVLLRRQLEKILAKADVGKPAVRFYPDYPDVDGIIKYYAGQGEMSDYENCSAPWTSVRIAPNGDVYPCLSYRMGNIREASIVDIWKGDQMQHFRDLFADGNVSACLGCCNLKACAGIEFETPLELAPALAVAPVVSE
jgi:radical SAM protein with 4Fe4S-binding SPASM domain